MVLGLTSILGGAGGILGGGLILGGVTGEGGKSKLQRALNFVKRIEIDPGFDFTKLTPEDLQVVAEFFPNFYEAEVPDEVKVANDSPELRGSVVRGITHLEEVARTGLPLGERLAAQEQGRRIARESGRVQGGILENLRRRGRAGGGTELQQRMAAGQAASEFGRGLGSDLAQQAVQNRLNATQQAATLAGGLRQQDINLSQGQADSVNRFNEFVSQLMTQAARDNAAAQERAQAFNVGNRQRVADVNVSERNRFALGQQSREDLLLQQIKDNEFRRAGLVVPTLGALAQQENAEKAAKDRAVQGFGLSGGETLGGLFDIFGKNGTQQGGA